MKAFSCSTIVAMIFVLFGAGVQAQYKGARDYFPKSYPAPSPGGQPATPPAPGNPPPAVPKQPKFKDVTVNGQFYFLSDTNRTYAWTKLSMSTAKNTKNGITQTIGGETPVQQ